MPKVESHSFTLAAPELVDRIRRGDHSAFEFFYRMEFLNLVHFAGSYLKDEERARDLAQEFLPGHYYWSRTPGMKRWYRRDWMDYEAVKDTFWASRGCCSR